MTPSAARRLFLLGAFLILAVRALAATPPLRCEVQGNHTIVSWPVTGRTYSLESTADLASGIWTSVSTPPIQADGRLSVTLPLEPKARFFRLRWTAAPAPVVSVVFDREDPDLAENVTFPEEGTCVDVTGDGCSLLNFVDAQMANTFDISVTIAGTDHSAVSYRWLIYFPVTINQGAPYSGTAANNSSATTAHYILPASSLPDLGPTELWRMVIEITNHAGPTPVVTYRRFRFGYLNSEMPQSW